MRLDVDLGLGGFWLLSYFSSLENYYKFVLWGIDYHLEIQCVGWVWWGRWLIGRVDHAFVSDWPFWELV